MRYFVSLFNVYVTRGYLVRRAASCKNAVFFVGIQKDSDLDNWNDKV